MRRKQKKTKEEKTAESFFPVGEEDIKYAVEKVERKIGESELQKVEKEGTKKRRGTSRKPSGKTGKISKRRETKFSPPKVTLKKGGYELVITEKPQAALKLASALGKYEKRGVGVPYYEVERNGEKIVVACAVGHLFTLKQNKAGQEIPIFEISWVPNFLARKKDFTKKYYDTLVKLAKNAGSVTIATDYDIEGEVIGFNVVRFICNQKDANRMKYSTLTEKELNDSYENKSKSIAWGQAIAGETRHYLDWFYGINLSRALMNAIKSLGAFKIMSIGRVQGPALKLIVDKERQIMAFKSKPYWQVFISLDTDEKIELKLNKDISKFSDLKKFDSLKGKIAEVTTEKKEQIIPPNAPFNLTTLQTEAYNLHGITPSRTLQIAQSLYLSGLISYPRTSSQKIPASINYNEILKTVAERFNAEKLITKKNPVEGNKTDPAHPSIYPTGNFQILAGEDEKIYNLISKRFLALFCDNSVIDNKKIIAKINNFAFALNGLAIRKKGWMEIYPVKLQEKEIPDVSGKIKILKVRTEEKQTQPPRRYSPASILSELEKKNLGTKATRSMILETLYDRNYIKERSIEATPLGMSLIETLEKSSPIIIDEKLTRNFEVEMDSIVGLKKGFEEKEKAIIEKAKETIKKIVSQFKAKEKEIGEELLSANSEFNEQRRKENVLNECPVCKKGSLIMNYSKKTRKHFVSCNAYPACKNTYSLPMGMIKKSEKVCESCKWPMVMRVMRGKRPWEFCFNPECEKTKERIEEYRKKKEAEGKQQA